MSKNKVYRTKNETVFSNTVLLLLVYLFVYLFFLYFSELKSESKFIRRKKCLSQVNTHSHSHDMTHDYQNAKANLAN